MRKPRTITIRNKRSPKDTVDILGLSAGDCRTLSRAIEAGAFEGGDRGGPVSHALLRFSKALAVPAHYPGQHADVVLVGATPIPEHLYEEAINL